MRTLLDSRMLRDIEISWQLNDLCNFNCPYCWTHWVEKSRMFRGIQDTAKVIAGFNRLKQVATIHMTGGEPFLFPDFVTVAQAITKKHYISVITNLTSPQCLKFADTIDPEKVDYIHCSLHVRERSKSQIKDFIGKFRYFKSKGFRIFVSSLMYPPVIKRFPSDFEFFKKQGIILHPKVFWGNYHFIYEMLNKPFIRKRKEFFGLRKVLSRPYPESYSKDENQLISFFIQKSHEEDVDIRSQSRTNNLYFDKYFLKGLPSFKGRICDAGRSYVRLDQQGNFTRCIDESHHQLGNLFEGGLQTMEKPISCAAKVCSCPYIGIRYAQNEYILEEQREPAYV